MHVKKYMKFHIMGIYIIMKKIKELFRRKTCCIIKYKEKYAERYNINVMPVNERIREMVYVALFYSESVQQISSIRNLERLKDNIVVHTDRKQKWILF